jgi:salicylate biosynthesis isochorismate synthase
MNQGRFFLEIHPNQILWLEGPWVEASSTQNSPWEFCIMPFKPLSSNSPRFLAAKRSTILNRELLSQCGRGKILENLVFSDSERSLFTQSFQTLQSLIDSGQLLKGVPWAYESAQYSQAYELFEAFLKRSIHISSSLALYGSQEDQKAVLGASPEWLFRIAPGGKSLETFAIAGTRWQGQVRTEQLETKDRFEHELVVQAIIRKLSPYGVVTAGQAQWVKAQLVEHLKTPIHLNASSFLDATEMLHLLHPTPAVGIFPHTKAGENWLYSLPGQDIREDFAAPWIVRHRGDRSAYALVGIRQIRMNNQGIIIPAGCGVVKDSQEEVEWNEIKAKIKSVKKGWGLIA